jgi:tetratricopeptide (TPR) repeat protein
MTNIDKDQFKINYETGKKAFEYGEYRRSVDYLEAAIAYTNPNSIMGGQAQIWLVTAYEAVGQRQDALSLCRKLLRHPDIDTRQQSKNLLYILEAPPLAKKEEWLTKIPDLTNLSESDKDLRKGAGVTRKSPNKKAEKAPIDLSQVNTKDNQFVWITLIGFILVIFGLFWDKF